MAQLAELVVEIGLRRDIGPDSGVEVGGEHAGLGEGIDPAHGDFTELAFGLILIAERRCDRSALSTAVLVQRHRRSDCSYLSANVKQEMPLA